jgi:hypothetical protein
MSKSKKTTTQMPKPKYTIGQRLFTIISHRGRPEEIWETKVIARKTYETKMSPFPGGKPESGISFSYTVLTPDSGHKELYEEEFYPSFQQAANKFAEAFLVQRPL